MTTSVDGQVLVIGAGVTGLAFAKAFGDARIFERTVSVGGKANTFSTETEVGTFYYDIGGHWFHHKGHPEVLSLFSDVSLKGHERKAFVYLDEQYLPFPIQQTYKLIRDQKVVQSITNELSMLTKDTPKNYRDLLLYSYGRTLFDIFFEPYNMKMYGVEDLTELSFSKQEATRNVRLNSDVNGYNGDFVYPTGTQGAVAIPRSIGKDVNIDFGMSLECLSLGDRKVTISDTDGTCVDYPYSKLISTMPLKDLAAVTTDLPDEYRDRLEELRSSRGLVLNLGVKKNSVQAGKHWIYFPDMSLSFYRVGFYSEVESELAPEGYNSMYVEVSPFYFDSTKESQEAVTKAVIDELVQIQLLDDVSDVLFVKPFYLEHNYCLVTEFSKELREYFAENNIHSIGRYGAWRWTSQHEDIIDAYQLAMEMKDESRNDTST